MKLLTKYITEIQKDKEKKAHALGALNVTISFCFIILGLWGLLIDSKICIIFSVFMIALNILIFIIVAIRYKFKGDLISYKTYLTGGFGLFALIIYCIVMGMC